MKKLKVINLRSDVINNLLEETSYEDYILEGAELSSKALPLVVKKEKTDEDIKELKKYTKRIAEINLIMVMISSIGD